ncbi:hypothetical protein NP188_24710, partial [Salmonella enterica]|nr:hypothetical protein [Salmonella enterica]
QLCYSPSQNVSYFVATSLLKLERRQKESSCTEDCGSWDKGFCGIITARSVLPIFPRYTHNYTHAHTDTIEKKKRS